MNRTHGLSDGAVARIRGVFARFPAVEKAVLYGSRAKGNPRPGSDIDLTLVGDGLDLSAMARIDEALDDLLLPYEFDLSSLAGVSHPDLLDHIRRVGVVFYDRTPVEVTRRNEGGSPLAQR